MLFTNAATTFSDHSLEIIIESLRRQDIIVDAIGPTWGEENGDDQNDRPPDSPMQTNEHEENSASARPTTNGHHHRSPRKPLTQQQQTGIRVINDIVNSTEGTVFTFRYKIKRINIDPISFYSL
jgi:hypothetical protein